MEDNVTDPDVATVAVADLQPAEPSDPTAIVAPLGLIASARRDDDVSTASEVTTPVPISDSEVIVDTISTPASEHAVTETLTTAMNSQADNVLDRFIRRSDTGPLQYTFAAIGDVITAMIHNPVRMLFQPIRSTIYIVDTIARGILTDLGVIKPNPMASAEIIAVRRAAAALVKTPEVKAAIESAIAYLASTPSATTSAGALQNRAILDQVVAEFAYAMAIQVVGQNAGLVLSDTAFMGSRYGLDNPDTFYRGFNLDPNATYVIRGDMNSSPYVVFQITNGFYGENGQTPQSLAVLDTTQMQVNSDGTFELWLGPDAAGEQPNYIQLDPTAVQFIIRDTLNNWVQKPSILSVEVVSGNPQGTGLTFEQMAAKTAADIVAGAPYWYGFASYYRMLPPNFLAPASTTAGGLTSQSSSVGNFSLTKDQALVITVHQFDAEYLGFEVGTDWYTSINYANHTSSLSAEQAHANADGSFTYVLSLKDPGVANWIDPAGHPTGLLQIRWQGLPAAIPAGYMPTVQLVNFADLAAALPVETVRVNAFQRARQISQRQSQVRSRLAGIPAALIRFDPYDFEPLF
ncbi:hypothetical protein ACNUDN_04400 [Mycobacterium sp. smrl_JER01]|uniref:hypothetical protein n=1 Tax=Mycobacterium sp. smrl_JER01 TaxID=3402633 RepID=UPI003AC99906